MRDTDITLVQQVRSFNRVVTERIAALNDRFRGRDRPLGEARLLWEIGGDEPEVRQLRARLGLDSAYVSRLLRSLERQGLVRVRKSPRDGRVRGVRLSRAGRSERKTLDKLSDGLARSLLQPLGKNQRTRLTAAMAEVERLLVASMVTTTIALYRRSGYREVPAFTREPYAHHWFEKRLSPPARGVRKSRA